MTVNQVSKSLISRPKPACCKLRCVWSHPMRHTCAQRFSRGLTLLELIIVMGIAGILLSIAIPSYRYVTGSNRVAAEVNGLVGDLQFARSEAIKEGQPVVICAANAAGTACLKSGSDWEGGWIVFPDTAGTQQLPGGATPLRVQSAFSSRDTLIANTTINLISYNREGFASAAGSGLSATSVLTLHTSPVSNATTRCLQVNQVGTLTVQPYNGGTCT
jgi:type IV fimbrial biogenesis protein FimT